MKNDFLSNHIREYKASILFYPENLFRYLAGSCKLHDVAWFVAANDMQTTQELAKNFNIVYATGADNKRVRSFPSCPNIVYDIAREKYPKLKKCSVDLICVTEAIFELDKDLLYKEVSRVLKKYGVFSYWVYGIPSVNPDLDELLRVFQAEIKNSSKNFKKHQLERNLYRFSFPFKETLTPSFKIRVEWDFHQYLAYLRSLVGLSKIFTTPQNFLFDLRIENFSAAWNLNKKTRTVLFPIELKMGIKT